MNRGIQFQGLRWRIILQGLLLAGGLGAASAQISQPTITSVRQDSTNIVVTTRVPSGLRCVTLESRERLGTGSWEPRAVSRLDGTGGVITFRVPGSRQTELMRVRGDATEPLPASFYAGTNSFLGSPGTSDSRGLLDAAPGATGPGAAAPPDPSRDVVESDIWKVRGETVYFFNQYRGLQIIDISDPDAAVLRGTLDLPAAGEDMYVLGSNSVVLLARNGCYYGTDESQVVIVRDDSGNPVITAKLPVDGFIQESRLVGTALYVASEAFRPMPGTTNMVWGWGTEVSSFDLADPGAPLKRGTLWYDGYGNVVAATDRYLFVVTQDPRTWTQSVVNLIDISAPDGSMAALGSVEPAGRISDKFKINLHEDVLTLISQVQSNTMLTSELETFSLAIPDSPRKLGELAMGMSELLNATRFDGNRVYVVTFHVQFRLDPLWVVDLSDPAHPAIKGQLEVPGWSTYLQPMGNRLLALGIETNLTTVSLFDVSNAAKPALLSRVQLGSGWSWSEANNDEKAFSVFPEAGLILVPYQSWNTNGYATAVQLIDLGTNALSLRGVIDQEFEPRRATVRADRILSISGREYLSADFSDRDQPMVRDTLDLAWPVDRVVLHGDYLIEVTTTSGWSWWSWRWANLDTPSLRVTLANDPDHVLNVLTLTNMPIIGVTQSGNHLYVAQGPSFWWWPLPLAVDSSASDDVTNTSPFLLTVLALDDLPQLPVVGQVGIENESLNWGGDLQALWPQPDTLVWVGGMNFWWWRVGPVALDGGVAGPAFRPWPWFWGGNGGQLLAFDVSHSDLPKFASETSLAQSNWWSFSQAFTAEGLVYLSHQTSEFIPGLDSPWASPAQTNTVVDTNGEVVIANIIPPGTWVQKFYLDVVDYADAQHPAVRAPVNIPGMLNGVSRHGALLYTLGSHWTTNWTAPWTEYLDGLAYDGVAAHLVDSLPLPAWPHPVLVAGEDIFIGRAASDYWSTNAGPSYLETWTLPDSGKFTQLGKVSVSSPASLLATFPGMLAAQQTDNSVVLFSLADPDNLRVIGQGNAPGCLWLDLNHADGEGARGLWIPLGAFGVARISSGP